MIVFQEERTLVTASTWSLARPTGGSLNIVTENNKRIVCLFDPYALRQHCLCMKTHVRIAI